MQLPTINNAPRDAETGLILPLSKSLGSQDLAKHRAMVAVELDVMAKKMDRFGWERDRGTATHDRMVTDWMDALQDYPLGEVKDACKEWVKTSPRKMPNEGDILGIIHRWRKERAAAFKSMQPREMPAKVDRPTPERAAEIMRSVGFSPKGFPKIGAGQE